MTMLVTVLLITSIGASIHASPCQRVVCYYTNWAQYRPDIQKFLPEDIDAKKCTHINYAFAKLKGNQLEPYEWNDDSTPWSKGMYERVYEHCKKENPKVKLLLSVGGWNMGSAPFVAMVANKDNRKEFAATSVEFLRKRNFDGLDIDWEYPGRRGSPPEDKENFIELLKILLEVYEADAQETGNPRLLLTAAVPAGKSNIDAGYDIHRVVKYLDFVNIMTYDLHGAWDNTTGHNSPLYARKAEKGPQRYLNVDWAATYWADELTSDEKKKLVIGLPTYGRSFTLKSEEDSGVGAPARGAGTAGIYTREAGFLSYYEICALISSGASLRYIEDQEVPYLVSGNQWVGYDNAKSLRNKVRYMKKHGFGGVMVWTFDLDDFTGSCGEGAYPLLSAIVGECTGSAGGSIPGITTPNPTEGTTRRPTTDRPTPRPAPTPKPPTTPSSTSAATTTPSTSATSTPATTVTTTSTSSVTPTPTPTATTEGSTDLANFCKGKPDGLYAHPTDSRKFINCASGNTYIQPCAPGTVFNPANGVCDFPANVE